MFTVIKKENTLKHNVLKNLEKDLNVFEKIEIKICSDLIIKIYRKGRIDEFNMNNKKYYKSDL